MKKITFLLVGITLFGMAGLLWLNKSSDSDHSQVLAEQKGNRAAPGQEKKTAPTPPSALTPTSTPRDASAPAPAPATLQSEGKNDLRKGRSGQEVKQVQEFLAKFPDVYPQGLTTGFYGNLTEDAIKKFQKSVSLAQSGTIDEQTRRKLGEVEGALARKKPPKISGITPTEIAVGTIVTLTGSGFTLENNSLFVRGKTFLTNLTSDNGMEIIFSLPDNLPCQTGQACPIKIVNTNGISNAWPFRLTNPEFSPSPEPEPVLEAPLSPLSPTPSSATTTLISISPSIVTTGMRVTLNGQEFTPASNTVTFTSAETQQAITSLASADGLTLELVIPEALPCKPVSECGVFVTNQNGVSNSLNFWLGQRVDPVTVLSPNGGEQVVSGSGININVSGGKSEALNGTVSLEFYLAAASANILSDPRELLLGKIPVNSGAIWDARQVCEGLVCWDVTPGDYKVLAVGPDILNNHTIWDFVTNKPGNIDVGDAPFTIVSTPTITIVSPNGGEAYKYQDTVTITWNAENIASKSVNIKLLKADSVVSTIASNVAQSTETGAFLYNWTVPSYLTPAFDYTLEISDAANAGRRDTSDGPFRVSSNVALKLLRPNEGEIAMRGFKIPLIWEYNTAMQSPGITVNLYKNGVFQQTLVTNLLHQGINGISSEDWQRYYQNHSPYPSFALINVPDVPDGSDYTLELVNTADASIRDQSDRPFPIISIPSPTTFKGRMIDAVTKAPIPNATFAGYTSQYPYTLPRFTSNANGEFSYSTTTEDMVSIRTGKSLFYGGNGPCNNITSGSLYRSPDLPRAQLSGGWLDWLAPYSAIRYPLVTPAMDFGNIPLWPTAQRIYTFTDLPASLSIYYQKEDGTITGGGGNSLYKMAHTLSYPFPLGFNTRVQFTDKAGVKHVSPFTLFSTDTRCPIAALSFMDGTFQWEPYPIGISMSLTGGIVGTFTKATLTTATYTPYRGTAPFTWKLLGGILPPGMAFDAATATVSGIPTAAGTYIFNVRVTDANGVRASQSLSITIK